MIDEITNRLKNLPERYHTAVIVGIPLAVLAWLSSNSGTGGTTA